MLSRVNQSVHLQIKVELPAEGVNGVIPHLVAQRSAILQQVVAQVIEHLQEQWIEAVERAEAELICHGCGVVHAGRTGWTRRGRRTRVLQTLAGGLVLPLVQTTCGLCGKTRAPYAEALGLGTPERYSAELRRTLIERVYEMSYRKSARLAQELWGVRLSTSTLHRFVQRTAERVQLTPCAGAVPLLADGTKVRAGERAEQEDLRLAFQLLGRSVQGGRSRAELRLVGLAAGLGSWPAVLRRDCAAPVVITDAEASLPAHVRACYPEARHQWCEWHVGYTLDWSLFEDRVPKKERKRLQSELTGILWGKQGQRTKQRRYARFLKQLPPRSRKQLERARPHILFDAPSRERTTSLVERQMREINRRVNVGVRWSLRGVENLMRLAMTQRHNADDYHRLWS